MQPFQGYYLLIYLIYTNYILISAKNVLLFCKENYFWICTKHKFILFLIRHAQNTVPVKFESDASHHSLTPNKRRMPHSLDAPITS